jgi:hypothetical protein
MSCSRTTALAVSKAPDDDADEMMKSIRESGKGRDEKVGRMA